MSPREISINKQHAIISETLLCTIVLESEGLKEAKPSLQFTCEHGWHPCVWNAHTL